MKKRISTLLAIVLTIALLASSFAMLGVSAENTKPATKIISVDGYQYEIYVDKNYTAYDSMAAAVNGLTPDSTVGADNSYLEGPAVSFANTAWKAEAKKLWGEDLSTPTYIKTHADYEQIAFHPNAQGFGMYSVSLYKEGLHVNPSHGWLGQTDTRSINLSFTAPEAGIVVLYDTKGMVSASKGANTAPFWDWLAGNVGKDWISFSIYKNDDLLWPLKREDNKLEKGGEQIAFPDVGQINVVPGDVITVKVEGFSKRAGIDINPAVAYALPDPNLNIPEEKIDFTIGDSTYEINKYEVYDAYTALTDLTKDVTPGPVKTPAAADTDGIIEFNSKWAMSYQYTNDDGFGKDPWGGTLRYKYTIPYRHSNGSNPGLYGIQAYSYLSINTWSNCMFTSAVTFLPDNKSLYLSPTTASDYRIEVDRNSIKKENVAPAIKLTFSAYRDGELYLFDKNGKIDGKVNIDPFWANEAVRNSTDPNGTMTVKIFKNDEQLWPAEGETAELNFTKNSIEFPDLGAIKVNKSDKISVVFYGDVEKPDVRLGAICNPAIAYAPYVAPTTEELVVGDKTYNVLIGESTDLYSGFTALTANMEPGKASTPKDTKGLVKFNANWEMAYQFVSDKGYGKDPWGGDLAYKYCVPYYSASNKDYNALYGIQVASYLAVNNYNTCMFTAATTLIPQGKKVYISPTTAASFAAEKVDKSVTAPTLKITYRSNIDGKAVLYDTTGYFDGNVASAPYWANENDKATTKIEIYKNKQKIWPTGEAQVISKNNMSIEFPDLGEIDLKIGDQISYVFYGNPEAPGTRSGVMCNPAIAFTEITKKVDPAKIPRTDADFSSDVMVLASVIVALGGVVVTMGFISKKRAHN